MDPIPQSSAVLNSLNMKTQSSDFIHMQSFYISLYVYIYIIFQLPIFDICTPSANPVSISILF